MHWMSSNYSFKQQANSVSGLPRKLFTSDRKKIRMWSDLVEIEFQRQSHYVSFQMLSTVYGTQMDISFAWPYKCFWKFHQSARFCTICVSLSMSANDIVAKIFNSWSNTDVVETKNYGSLPKDIGLVDVFSELEKLRSLDRNFGTSCDFLVSYCFFKLQNTGASSFQTHSNFIFKLKLIRAYKNRNICALMLLVAM